MPIRTYYFLLLRITSRAQTGTNGTTKWDSQEIGRQNSKENNQLAAKVNQAS